MLRKVQIFSVIVVLVLVVFHTDTIFSQTIRLKQRTYVQNNGKWFLSVNGTAQNPIVLNSLIVRMKDRSDPRNFEFERIGLSGIRVTSKALFGNF